MICIDAGHGGSNRGAQANGIDEAAWNLEFAYDLGRFLREMGIRATLIRRHDEHLGFSLRAAVARASGCELAISIHVNANAKETIHGLETYYLPGSEPMRAFGEAIMRRAPESLYKPRWEPIAADASKGKWLQNPANVMERYDCDALLVEVGFCSNEGDAAALQEEATRLGLCMAIAGALLDL